MFVLFNLVVTAIYAEQVFIAVLPYSNLTGSEDYAWLRESLLAEINNSMRERFKFSEDDTSSVVSTLDSGIPISEKI